MLSQLLLKSSSLQQVFVRLASALTDLGVEAINAAGTDAYLHFEVVNEKVIGGSFFFTIDIGSAFINNQATARGKLKTISFNYIVIG